MSPFKTLIFLPLLALVALFSSCGSSTQSSGNYSSSGSWSGTDGTVTSGSASSIASNIISQTSSCSSGTRLTTKYFQLSVSGGVPYAYYASTSSAPSSVTKFWVGASNFNDVLIVYYTGSAYYAAVSMCPYDSTLTSSRTITGFHTQNGIALSSSVSSSGMGSIRGAKDTAVQLDSSTWYGPTTFYAVTISD